MLKFFKFLSKKFLESMNSLCVSVVYNQMINDDDDDDEKNGEKER